MSEDILVGDNNVPGWLAHHLQHNHFPPVDLSFAGAALEAIELCSMEDYDVTLTLPNGNVVAAWQVVEGLHLEEMVEPFDASPFADELAPCEHENQRIDDRMQFHCIDCGEELGR